MSDVEQIEAPVATSSPADHVTILDTMYQVVLLWGDGNCFFRGASLAIYNNNGNGHIQLWRAVCR